MTRKAYVLDEGVRFDVSDARKYGEVVFIFKRDDPRPPVWSASYAECVLKRLDELGFVPDKDFIVVTGNVAALVTVVGNLARKTRDSINLLLFDSSQEEYTHKVLL